MLQDLQLAQVHLFIKKGLKSSRIGALYEN